MGLIKDLYKTNKNKFNIFIIYITEAHATDIWNIGESAGVSNSSHKQISDRIRCAKNLIKEYNMEIPVYCDNMDNTFETQFASWPFRYFITYGKTLVNIGNPVNSEFDFGELLNFINNITDS